MGNGVNGNQAGKTGGGMMSRPCDNLIGMVFGRWTVVSRSKNRSYNGNVKWLCRCQCGTEKEVAGDFLKRNKSTSCGCYQKEKMHWIQLSGISHTPEYTTWMSMLSRCENPNDAAYKHYGGRGITICDEWHDINNFIADMGKKPSGKSLDRIDVNSHYNKNNCRWATPKEQQNNRRNNIVLTINGISKTLSEWSKETGICHKTLDSRFRRGWNPVDILNTSIPQKTTDII